MGEISGPYAVASAAVGAFAGDAISYWVGWRWGDRLRGIWPFSRYPQLIERGETLFRRNAAKSILIARYVGAIRPFVPAIAGIARMPCGYAVTSIASNEKHGSAASGFLSAIRIAPAGRASGASLPGKYVTCTRTRA